MHEERLKREPSSGRPLQGHCTPGLFMRTAAPFTMFKDFLEVLETSKHNICVCVETMSNLCVSLLLLSCWTCYCSHHKVLFLSAWPCKMNGTGLRGHKRDKSAGTSEAVAVCQCHLRYQIVITHLSSTGMFPTPRGPAVWVAERNEGETLCHFHIRPLGIINH